jgi:hypothetical protein
MEPLPSNLEDLSPEKLASLIKSRERLLKRAIEIKGQVVSKPYMFESKRDRKMNAVDKKIRQIKVDLYTLNYILDVKNKGLMPTSTGPIVEVKHASMHSAETSPDQLFAPSHVSPKKSNLRSIMRTIRSMTKGRTSKKPTGGKRRTQRRRRQAD